MEALDIDPDCDVAVATLAQLSLQQGKIDDAIKWFERSGKLSRTEAELVNAITCKLICMYGVWTDGVQMNMLVGHSRLSSG